MGIMPRQAGDQFVITSDRLVGDSPTNTAPKVRKTETYQSWTGDQWSAIPTEARAFETIEIAEEYMRANYGRLMS